MVCARKKLPQTRIARFPNFLNSTSNMLFKMLRNISSQLRCLLALPLAIISFQTKMNLMILILDESFINSGYREVIEILHYPTIEI